MKSPGYTHRLTTSIGALVTMGVLVSAQAQPSLETRVRELYASAEYEEALSLVGESNDPAAQQYRALCLMALGRQSDAEAAVQRLILAAPEFKISEEDAPPRFVALVAEQRRQVVPTVVRRLFAEARDDYRAKAYEKALPQFQRVLALSSGSDIRAADGVEDLRLLAESFIEIAKASNAPKPEVVAPAPQPSAAAARSAPARRYTPPIALKQDMPPWLAGDVVGRALSGSVRVEIDSSGRVTSALMVRQINPRYDTRVLAATAHWEYRPATENGQPVPSTSVVDITINPVP
jgi:hypothetical protein